MLAESVPDIQTYLQEAAETEESADRAPYETLVYVIEQLITILPKQSRTLEMVRNLQQQVLGSKRDLRQINKSYIMLQAENQLMKTQLKTASCSARLK